MLALAAQPNFTVLATYTKPLTGIPSEGSSGVCRHPLQLIPLSQKTILVDNYQSKLKTISSKLGELDLEKLPNSEFLKLAGTGSSTTDTPQMADLWVGCKYLFREEVLKTEFLDNSFIKFGYAWNLCFSKKFNEIYTFDSTCHMRDLKKKNLMLKGGNNIDKYLLKTLKAGTLYVPTLVDHAGCDIFCVLNVDSEKVLICIVIRSGKNYLTDYQKKEFPELVTKVIEEVKNESMELARDENKNVDRAEYLVLRPGVKYGHGCGDSPLPWKEKIGSSALMLLGSFVQLIPSILEAKGLFK